MYDRNNGQQIYESMDTQDITIDRFPIRLGQFLKLANIVSDGIEGKFLISNGEVSVNGVLELRRGKQLAAGDIVSLHNISFRCVAAYQKVKE